MTKSRRKKTEASTTSEPSVEVELHSLNLADDNMAQQQITNNRFAALQEGDSQEMETMRDVADSLPATIPMNMILKEDLNWQSPDPRFPAAFSRYVNRSFWIHSGPVIRVFNSNLEREPEEYGIIRIPKMEADAVPGFLFRNRNEVKRAALERIHFFTKESGYNLCLDPKVTLDEWTLRYTVSSLSPAGIEAAQGKEPTLWFLHNPEFLQKRRGIVYEDGSREEYLVLNAYVNLVKPSYRIRQPQPPCHARHDADVGPGAVGRQSPIHHALRPSAFPD